MENLNGNNIKRVLAINDLSCFGKCSLTVSIPIISHFGVEVVPLPTALLSNHTGRTSINGIYKPFEIAVYKL